MTSTGAGESRATALTILAAALAAVTLIPAGCSGPLGDYDSDQVRREVVAAARANLSEAHDPIDQPAGSVPLAQVNEPSEQDQRLDAISGPHTYAQTELDLGADLTGHPSAMLPMTLNDAVGMAVANNLDVRIARIVPRISRQQVAEAEAAFDPALFADATFNEIEQPLQARSIGGSAIETDVQRRDSASMNVGVRRQLETGGQVSVSTGVNYINDKSPDTEYTPDPGHNTNVTLAVTHPVLRNFGREANRAQIALSENAHARDKLELQRRLLQLVADTEAAYWQLVLARYQLAIRQSVLDLTVKTEQDLQQRRGVDVSPLQLAQARSFVELRQSDVVSSQRALRDASDQLKQLLNAPELPLVGEEVIDPADRPGDEPTQLVLTESIKVAIEHRPEIQQALLNIDDAWIRQTVAENQQLPQLDFTAQLQLLGLDDNSDQAYGEIGDGEFIDWLVGLQFEMPLGNRAANALYQQQVLARQAHVLGYRRAAMNLTLSVKQAIRAQQSAYELIKITRATRRATAENLRTLEEREKAGQELTPEFLLDLKLSTQQRLAEAELREMRAVVDYNIAKAQYDLAVGRLLSKHGIEFVMPRISPDLEALHGFEE